MQLRVWIIDNGRFVKQSMHNPKSFEHAETRYTATSEYAGIVMVYRGTNAFGAIVTNSVKAKIGLEDCSVISVGYVNEKMRTEIFAFCLNSLS